MNFNIDSIIPPGAIIKVIGIGGGGCNAINTMIKSNVEGVEFITVNTDIQALKMSLAPTKIQIGKQLTKGLGAGADPDIGRDAALEDRHEIQEALKGADMVFVTAGMGGGTGTGGISVVAQIAKELGALTVGVVTKPFLFEGKRRNMLAEIGIERLRSYVDTLITIPNQKLLQIAPKDLSLINAFKLADSVLTNAVKGISDIINIPGVINVDFADVKTIMASTGMALMGIGSASGENRAVRAATQAISSPLLEDINIMGATGILINITASPDVSLAEINEACSKIHEVAHEDANIIFGAVIDENLHEEIHVTVIATGFPSPTKEETTSAHNVQIQSVLKTSKQQSYKESLRSYVPPSISSSREIQGASVSKDVYNSSININNDVSYKFNNTSFSPSSNSSKKINKDFVKEETFVDMPKISPIYEAQELAKWTMGTCQKASSFAVVDQNTDINQNKSDQNQNAFSTNILFDLEEDFEREILISNNNNIPTSLENKVCSDQQHNLNLGNNKISSEELDVINSFKQYEFDNADKVMLDDITINSVEAKKDHNDCDNNSCQSNNEVKPDLGESKSEELYLKEDNYETHMDNNFEQKINEVLELAEKIQQNASQGEVKKENSSELNKIDANFEETPAFLRAGKIEIISLD